MPIAPAMAAEEHDGIAVATSSFLGKVPVLLGIEPDQCFDPALAIEIGPLIGEAQMRIDDAATDRLDIEHAGIAAQMLAGPGADIVFEPGTRMGMNDPIVEHPVGSERLAGRMPPPAHFALDDGTVSRDMFARQHLGPEMAGRVLA